MALRSGRVGIHPSQVDPITGMLLNGPTPGSMSFEDLSDAQISNPEAGQTLQYNGTGWENVFASISPTTLSALQDVQITDPEDGEYLTYDSVSSKWINSGEAPVPEFTDITVTLYGAVEDTISFTDAAGISHSEVFASGQSSKSVTFKINPTGSTSITFTSGVAKNPDDLTADYSKSVTITSATTEIKVMPDNALYWYGYKSDKYLTPTLVPTQNISSSRAVTENTNNITVALSSGYNLSGPWYSCGALLKYSDFAKINLITSGSTTDTVAIVKASASANYKLNTITTSGLYTMDKSNPTASGGTISDSDDVHISVYSGATNMTLSALWYE